MSFLDNVAFEGMKVVMKMDKEARSWGREGPPDGATGVLVGRSRYKMFKSRFGIDRCFFEPGIYEQDGTWMVKMDNPEHGNIEIGGALTGIFMGSGDFDVHPDSKAEYEARAEQLWHIPVNRERTISSNEQEGILANRVRLGDLPDSKAVEGDTLVLSDEDKAAHAGYRLVVVEVNYSYDDYLYDVHAYDEKSGKSAYSTGIRESQIASVVRGNVWKYDNNRPLEFASLEEEAGFHRGTGRSTEIKNPNNQLYRWTLEEFKDAVRDGIVDCMTNGVTPFTSNRSISAYRFHDRNLGERLRAATIEGFAIEGAAPAGIGMAI